MPEIRILEAGIGDGRRDAIAGARGEPETVDLKSETRNPEPETRNPEAGIWDG